jgi:hypothetical protein
MIGVVSRKTGTNKGCFPKMIPTVYISPSSYEGVYDLLACQTGRDVQSGMTLLVNYHVHIKGRRVARLIGYNFPKKVKDRHRVIVLAYGGYDCCTPVISRRGRWARKAWHR